MLIHTPMYISKAKRDVISSGFEENVLLCVFYNNNKKNQKNEVGGGGEEGVCMIYKLMQKNLTTKATHTKNCETKHAVPQNSKRVLEYFTCYHSLAAMLSRMTKLLD